MFDEMVVAKERGVEINVFTDHHFNTTSMNKLDESKVNAFQSCSENLQSAGINVFVVNGVHSKLVMADNRFMSVGSFNWCSAARTGDYANLEASVVYSGDLAGEIALQLEKLRSRMRKTYQAEDGC